MQPSEPNGETATRDWLVPADGGASNDGASNDGASNDGAAEAKDNRRMPEQKDQQARDEKHPIQQAAAAPAQDQKAKDDKGGKQGGEPPRPKWPFAVAGVVVAAFIGVVLWVIFRPHPDVWTDDAYVAVHYASVAPRVSGQVTTVLVDDNQQVKTGQVLVMLDPRDYAAAMAAADAALARDAAQVAEVTANLVLQPSIISQQEANVEAARANLAFAEPNARRYDFLAATESGTVEQKQKADSELLQAKAQLDSALASLEAARRQLDIIAARKSAAEAVVEADKAQLEQAKLNLSYTQILSPVDGLVGERSVQVGNTVAPGSTLMTVVPLAEVYITANYREVDLLHVRSGQHVTIHVDAYHMDLSGTVEGLAPASGASFAPIQPNNATGNFTKIVQRLPVKINLDPDQPLARLLRVGFSVETTIHTGLQDVVDEQRRSGSLAR
jgi:membrane fusion protein (multidrug efflux system)